MVGVDFFFQDSTKRNTANTSVVVYVTKGTYFFTPSDELHNIDKVTYCVKNKIDILYKVDVMQKSLAFYDENKDVTRMILKLL